MVQSKLLQCVIGVALHSREEKLHTHEMVSVPTLETEPSKAAADY